MTEYSSRIICQMKLLTSCRKTSGMVYATKTQSISACCSKKMWKSDAARREQRPVHCTLDAFNGTYRRNYEGDYLCSPMEVRRMFADADISRPADGRILKNFSWDDIDRPSLNQYRLLFSVARPSHPWLSLPDEELMRKLGGYRKDRETGEEGFTVAGLLMFGKFDSIRDENCVPRFFPDYKEIPVNTMEQRWIDRIYPDGSWEANLFQFYRRVLPKLQKVIPTPFKLENSQRIDETLAHESIREALENKINHERLRYALPLHPADITRILQRLTKLEMLTSDGHGRGTIYRINDSSSEQTLQGSGQTLQAETAGPRHISRNMMYEKIVSFCSDWRSAEEIAVFVQRSKRYLTNEVLPEMSALLDLKYPQVKRHPDQQYRRKTIEDQKEQ